MVTVAAKEAVSRLIMAMSAATGALPLPTMTSTFLLQAVPPLEQVAGGDTLTAVVQEEDVLSVTVKASEPPEIG